MLVLDVCVIYAPHVGSGLLWQVGWCLSGVGGHNSVRVQTES